MTTSPPICLAAPDPLDRWSEFVRAARDRLEESGIDLDASRFERDADAVLVVLQQEALDLAGKGFVLWLRLAEMRERLGSDTPQGWGDDD